MLAEYRDAELQSTPHAARVEERSSNAADRRPRHACGGQHLDADAQRRSRRRLDSSRRRAGRCSGKTRPVAVTVAGARGRRVDDARPGSRSAADGAVRGSRSTIRCSKAGIAPRSTPSTARRGFPDASRSTSSRCRRSARWRAIRRRARRRNGFGADVLAVADGTIAAAVDDIAGR